MKDLLTRTAQDAFRIGSAHCGSRLYSPKRFPVVYGQFIWTFPGATLNPTTPWDTPLVTTVTNVGAMAHVVDWFIECAVAPAVNDLKIEVYLNGATMIWGPPEAVWLGLTVGHTTETYTFYIYDDQPGHILLPSDKLTCHIDQGDASCSDLVMHLRYYYTTGAS